MTTDIDNEIDGQVFLNGVNAVTGEYLSPPQDVSELAATIKSAGVRNDPAILSWLRRVWRALTAEHRGLPWDVQPDDVGRAGWGIVFHENEDPAVKAAMEPLVAHRRAHATDALAVRELCYRDGEQ